MVFFNICKIKYLNRKKQDGQRNLLTLLIAGGNGFLRNIRKKLSNHINIWVKVYMHGKHCHSGFYVRRPFRIGWYPATGTVGGVVISLRL